MDEALVNGFATMLKNLGPARLAMMAGAAVLMIGLFVFMIGRVSQPQMGLLYSGLELKDSGEIVARLEQQGVPYDLRANGSQIYVPSDAVLRLRMTMAGEGLPSGGSIGYEIFDRTDALGTTSFVQNVNLVRALEGELARTIRTFGAIENARVHLVLPRRELFSRETQPPSASIVLKVRGRGRLERSQVSAIQHLVAASVPGLSANRISIVDDSGNLLVRSQDQTGEGGMAEGMAEEMRVAIENRLRNNIERLLERSAGTGNIRAEVSVDMNLNRITESEERYDPDGQVVRSTQTVEDTSNSEERNGPQPTTVASNLPTEQNQSQNNGPVNSTRTARTEETTNFEISKTNRTRVQEAGNIERITVAVLVNGLNTPGEGGQTNYAARTPEELEQMAALVRTTVGFDQRRGDQVQVVNMRFVPVESLPDLGGAFLGLSKSDYFKIAEFAIFILVALLLILLVLRPLVGRMVSVMTPQGALADGGQGALMAGEGQAALAGPEPAGLVATAIPEPEDTMISLGTIEGQLKASSVRKIGEIIDKHPDEALAILRTWLYEE